VHVPDIRRIKAVPGGRNELVIGEMRRQRRTTRIPEALFGPAPGAEAEAGAARAEKP